MAAVVSPRPRRQLPWVEKYRPRRLDDIQHQPEVVSVLRGSLSTGSLNHMLFYGPPGTGKTSAALALAHELFTHDLFKDRVLELNASDERGISVVRNKINSFAMTTSSSFVNGKEVPPFKVIILDEADSMTGDAQAALRRTMEKHAKITRFCIICNYISRIIEPIASRCAKFRFQPLPESIVMSRLQHIAEGEHMSASNDVLRCLFEASGGDLRRAITTLQSVHRLYGPEMSVEAVKSIAGVVDESVADNLFASLSKSFDRLQLAVKSTIAEGFGAVSVLDEIEKRIVASDLQDGKKARALLVIAESDVALSDGADEYLQLLSTLGQIKRILMKR